MATALITRITSITLPNTEDAAMMTISRFALVGLVALSAACNRSPKPSAATPAVPVKPLFVVSADELVAEYKKNEIAADAKFKGQLIDVNGRFARVGRGLYPHPYLQFITSSVDDVFGVTCYLTKESEAEAGGLKEGDKITMRGVCQGMYAGQALRLFDCVFVK